MFYTYILTNPAKTVFYTGHTDDLTVRMQQHKYGALKGFTAKYNCNALLWYEIHNSRDAAFKKERQIKAWKRDWKRNLIGAANPGWDDLSVNMTMDDLYTPERMSADTRAELNL